MLCRAVIIALTILFAANCIRIFTREAGLGLLASYDVGWLVRTGDEILKTHALPLHDTFSWTSQGRCQVLYQWLFEVVLASLVGVGSIWAGGLFACLLGATVLLVIMPMSWLKRGIPPLVVFGVLQLTFTEHCFGLRPQLISLIFLLATTFMLERMRLKQTNVFYFLLPLLFIVWANSHLFWSIGLLLVATYALCDIFRSCVRRRPVNRALLLMALACCAAVLVNPYGAHLMRYALSFVDRSQWMDITELNPCWPLQPFVLSLSYLALLWTVFLLKRQSLPAEAFVITLAITITALMIRRYLIVAEVVSWPYLGYALSSVDWSEGNLFRYSGKHGTVFAALNLPTRKSQLSYVVVALLIATLAWFAVCPSRARAEKLVYETSRDVIDFTATHVQPSDRIFNDAATGSMLIFRQGVPVYIDTRFDMYKKTFVEEWTRAILGNADWSDILARHKITVALVKRDCSGLNRQLAGSPSWDLALDDSLYCLWVPADSHRLTQWGIDDSQIKNSGLSDAVIESTIRSRRQQHLLRSQAMK